MHLHEENQIKHSSQALADFVVVPHNGAKLSHIL